MIHKIHNFINEILNYFSNKQKGGESVPKRSKEEIIQRMNEGNTSKRVCLGNCTTTRAFNMKDIDKEAKKVPFVMISDDNAGERYDWWEDETYIEELDVKGANFESLRTFFTDHRKSVDTAIGRIDNIRVDKNALKADVFFGSSDRANDVFTKYTDGILTDVSIGYRVNDVMITERKDEPTHILVTDFDILELSAVWKGFDAGASVGREAQHKPPDVVEQDPKLDSRDTTILKRKLELKEKVQ